MRRTRVLADANILYSRTLRDWLILIQLQSVSAPYTTYWTEDILSEAMYHLRRNNPTWDGARTAQVREKVAGSLEGGRVDDFVVDGSFPGDPHDQHVHAAAVAAEVDIVLTADGGFTTRDLANLLPYEVYGPDDFFLMVDDSAPDLVREAADAQLRYYRWRLGSADLCDALHAAGCPRFAERVRRHLRSIDA
jgi:hypothetical protein